MFEASAPKYQDVPGLVRKYYLLGDEGRVGGGVYLWETRDAADALYDEAWRAGLESRYGAPADDRVLRELGQGRPRHHRGGADRDAASGARERRTAGTAVGDRSRSTSSTLWPTTPELEPERTGAPRRRRQEHRPPHVLGAGRAGSARAHTGRRRTASDCASSSTATSRRPVRRCGDRGLPLLVELRNALGETVQIGVPAGGRRRVRRARRGRARPAVHRRQLAAVAGTPFERRQGARRLHPRSARGPAARRAARRAPATRSWCPTCSAGARHDLQARIRPQRRRDRARDVVAGRPDPRPCRGSGRRRDLDGRADGSHRRFGRIASHRDVDGRRPSAHGEPRVRRVPAVIAATTLIDT